jgi:hypothetical protein
MAQGNAREQLIGRLAEILGSARAEGLVAALPQSTQVQGILVLLSELGGVSSKVVQAAIETLPELHRRDRLGDLVSWLEVC